MKIKIIVLIILGGLFLSACEKQTEINETEIKNDEVAAGQNGKIVTVDEAVENALKAGDEMPEFTLSNIKNEQISSQDLLKKSNLIVVFYRGDWCPFCNMYLKKLQDNIKEIKANGGELVAISVENPDDSMTVAQKNDLEFTVLSDKNLDLARKFKIVYELPPETNEKYKKGGIDLVKDNGTAKPELPVSATYVVNQEGKITYAFLNPDFKERLEPEAIIEELKKINQ